MDRRRAVTSRWSRVPSRAAGDKRLGLTDLRVLIALTQYVDKAGLARPSLATIAEVAGLDRRNVPASIKRLRELGYLRKLGKNGNSMGYAVLFGSPTDIPPHATDDMPGDDTSRRADIPRHDRVTSPGMTGDIPRHDRRGMPGDARTSPIEQPMEQSSGRARDASRANTAGTRLQNPFTVPEAWIAWAVEHHPDVDHQLEAAKFTDFWHAKAGAGGVKRDWPATWRNWIRNVRPTHGQPKGGAMDALRQQVARTREEL